MNVGTLYRPRLASIARVLMSTAMKETAAPPSPRCDDCQLPATFRAAVLDARHRQVRVHQCVNCAKVIWGDK